MVLGRCIDVARFDLTDVEWSILEPLLPEQGRRGGRWRDHRQVINGICWVKRTGSPWADMPERYGPYQTAYDRFCRWRDDGTWARLKAAVIALAEAEQDIDWDAQADSTIVRAHQHAAGARKGGWTPRRRRHVKVWVAPRGTDHEGAHYGRWAGTFARHADHAWSGFRHQATDRLARPGCGRPPRRCRPATQAPRLGDG